MIIEDPHSKDEDGKTPIQRRLAADSIDFLIITTCTSCQLVHHLL